MELTANSVGKFIALGGTCSSHRDASIAYRWPQLWLCPDSAVINEGEKIRIPNQVENVVGAPELTAVVGTDLHQATEEEAWEGIAGFTVSNDVYALGDWPGRADPNSEKTTGIQNKLLPTFAPLLSSVAPRGDRHDYENLALEMYVDDEPVVQSSTADYAFSISEMVAHTSQILPLERGDVVSLGEPDGEIRYLDTAETVTCRIEDIGELKNPIYSKSPTEEQ